MALLMAPLGYGCTSQQPLVGTAPAQMQSFAQAIQPQMMVLPAGIQCMPQMQQLSTGALTQAQFQSLQVAAQQQQRQQQQRQQQSQHQQVHPSQAQDPKRAGTRRQQQQQRRQQLNKPSAPAQARSFVPPMELIAAVQSLYHDQLKPFGRILRKRLTERAQAQGGDSSDVDVKDLRAACEACPYLVVQDAEGADWTALIVGQAENFVDVYSPEDVYPAQLWQDTANYFESLQEDDMVLPGGRYMCAQVLAQRNLPFLAGYSLGQIAHIVQLAISLKKLLGYSSGSVVPYAHSQSMLKDRHAQCQRPCPGVVRGKLTVANWDTMRDHLKQLLAAVGTDSQTLPLSNIKRLFRAQFGVELSETALGYAKLSELLQDPRLSDLCEVKLHGYGYVLIPTAGRAKRSLISLADTLCLDDTPSIIATLPPPPPPPLEAPKVPDQSATKRSMRPKPLCMDAIVSPPGSPTGGSSAADDTLLRRLAGEDSDLSCRAPPPLLATTPMSVRTPFPPTPSPSAAYGMTLPRLLGSIRAVPPGLSNDANATKPATQAPTPPPRGPPPAPPSPLCASASALEAAVVPTGTPSQGAARGHAPLGRRTRRSGGVLPQLAPPPFSQSTLDNFGYSVQNTFIHAALPPPTPIKAAAHLRARSLPRSSC
mmetsp:Transcript_10234/g.29217  ORF Transcript_10234/g.29217 Transcript_10234/m.29217 type:complete len:651 (+) Transcript_10234:72-2024(+)